MLKKGDKVVMHTCGEAEHYKGKIWTCCIDEQKLHPKHDYTVVWLEGFSGAFCTEFLQVVDIQYLQTENEGLKKELAQIKQNLEDLDRYTIAL